MKLDCCGGVKNALGVLLMVAFFLVGCASDGSVVAPDSQNEKNLNGNLSSFAESSGNSSSSVSSSSKDSSNSYANIGKSMAVFGLAQNGPYADSSVVTLTVLNESTLEPTEQVFTGLVEGGFGGYSVKAESLKSNIVQISVSGKYLEAKSGRLSENELTLYALTDMDVHDSVNVNLFTTLEYERVRELVKNKKLSFANAKKQAQKELLDAFHVKDENGKDVNFDAPESWNIYGIRDIENRDEDKVLMGITAIFSPFSGNFFESFVKNFAEDFAKDGKWDSDSTRKKIADVAYNLNVSVLHGDAITPADIQSIRSTMTRWRSVYTTGFDLSNIASNVILPDFESVIDEFWLAEYGLDKCDNENLGKVAKTLFGSYFTCKEDTRTRTGIRWLSSSVLETNTYGIKCESSDYFLMETTDRTPLSYVCDYGKWRNALDVEGRVGLCMSEKEGSLEDTDLFGYVCKSEKWEIYTDTLEDKVSGKRYAYRKAAGLYWMIDDWRDTTFTWAEAQCPEGWKLPTEDEWEELSKQLAGVTANGSQLNLVHVGESNSWWSSTEKNDSLAVTANVWHHPRSYDESLRFNLTISALEKERLAAVRCVKKP